MALGGVPAGENGEEGSAEEGVRALMGALTIGDAFCHPEVTGEGHMEPSPSCLSHWEPGGLGLGLPQSIPDVHGA